MDLNELVKLIIPACMSARTGANGWLWVVLALACPHSRCLSGTS